MGRLEDIAARNRKALGPDIRPGGLHGVIHNAVERGFDRIDAGSRTSSRGGLVFMLLFLALIAGLIAYAW